MNKEINMIDWEKKAIEHLKDFKINKYNFKTEEELEVILMNSLKSLLIQDKIRIKSQSKSEKDRRLIPDITLGTNQILIELKYLKKNLNDIYRMFYQAVKYTKITKDHLIFFIYDPNFLLTHEDKKDLKLSTKIMIIVKH